MLQCGKFKRKREARTLELSWKKKFFTIYAGQAFSIIGSAAVQFAIIFHLTLQTGSAVTLSIAAIAGYLPGILFGSFAGVHIDRNKKKTIMMISDGGIALSSIVLAVAFMMPIQPSNILIYIILFVRGIGTVFHGISMQAAIPLFVPGKELVKAGGWAQLVNGAGNLIGPVIGALLIKFMDMEYVMLVDIVGAILAIICLMCVKLNDPKKEYTKEEKPDFWGEFRHGLKALKKNKLLYRTIPHYVITGFLYMPLNALFMLLVVNYYGGGEAEASYMEIAIGLGMILGSIIVGQFGKMKRKLTIFSLATAIMGSFAFIVGALPPTLFWFGVIITFVWGIVVPFFSVPFGAYAQESILPEDMGRVTSLIYTLCYIGNPLGIAIAGPIADIVGINKLFMTIGILLVINALLCVLFIWKLETEYLYKITVKKKN